MISSPLRIAIAGTGWRSEFFARVCRALPQRFTLLGIMYHSEKGRQSVLSLGVPLVDSLEALAALKPDCIVISLSGPHIFDALLYCAQRDIPVLCETFIAESADQLNEMYPRLKNARLQFAEQYQFQPLNAARLALADSGVLGGVYYARMAIPTRHHPASLVRLALHTGHRLPVISGQVYRHDMLRGPGRGGDPTGEELFSARQEIVTYDYGDRQAVNDFEDMQHRSFMRDTDFLLRGPRGEIANDHARYMLDALTPCELTLKRVMTGADNDQQGLFLRGIAGGQQGWLYQNPFIPARLYDDELAVAACMTRMADYLTTGRPFYGIEDEFTDMYFALETVKALETGEKVQTQHQSWMD